MRTLLLVFALGAAALALAGCGIGSPGPEAKVSEVTDDYLRALAAGDTSTACAQLAPNAKQDIRGECSAMMAMVAQRVGKQRLTAAADAGVDLDVDDSSARVKITELGDVVLLLTLNGDRWLIRDGFDLSS